MLELFGDNLVFWVPFYYELKIAILILLQLPQFKFASQIYVALIQPYFRAKEKDIDLLLETAQKLINAKIQQGLAYLASNGPAFMAALFTAAATWHAQPSKAAAPQKKPIATRLVEAMEDAIRTDVQQTQPARKGKGIFDQFSAPPIPGDAPKDATLVDELKRRHGTTDKEASGGAPPAPAPHSVIATEPGAREGERPPQLIEEAEDEYSKKDR